MRPRSSANVGQGCFVSCFWTSQGLEAVEHAEQAELKHCGIHTGNHLSPSLSSILLSIHPSSSSSLSPSSQPLLCLSSNSHLHSCSQPSTARTRAFSRSIAFISTHYYHCSYFSSALPHATHQTITLHPCAHGPPSLYTPFRLLLVFFQRASNPHDTRSFATRSVPLSLFLLLDGLRSSARRRRLNWYHACHAPDTFRNEINRPAVPGPSASLGIGHHNVSTSQLPAHLDTPFPAAAAHTPPC